MSAASSTLPAPPATPDPGLSSAEAEARLRQFGPNDPASAKRRSPLLDLLFLFLNPLAIILLLAAGLSAFVGQKIDAAIIVVMVVVGALINFFQTYRSQNAIQKLRSEVATTATVMRDGQWQELDRKLIVPGDLLRLCAGDLIAADAVLRTARDLYVQQAALTGESAPAEKEAGD